jgi:uncharacterized small protein (DUF1192 family)
MSMTPDMMSAPELRERITALEAEVERLRKGNNDMRHTIDQWQPSMNALKAEVDKLRAALEAIEKLALQASISSCTCLTKTPDIAFHDPGCRYVLLQYIVAQCEDVRAALNPTKEKQ